MKKLFSVTFWVSALFTLIAWLVGADGALLAAVGDIPDGGTSASGSGDVANPGSDGVNDILNQQGDGIATETGGRAQDERFYVQDIDRRITKIRPMSTPVDQISRHAKASQTQSMECKYYSVGTRPIKTSTTAAFTKMTTPSQVLKVADPTIFTKDDTIRVVGVKAETKADGTAYSEDEKKLSNCPDLVLCVCGRDAATNMPIVFAVNGTSDASIGAGSIIAPAIPQGTKLVRMGKACGELDVQTGRFNNNPEPDVQYCQNFMIQVEQSTFDKMAAKEADWSFTDLEEDSIFDMRTTQELTFLFGHKRKVQHVSKENMLQWFTGGIYWMPTYDYQIGTWDEGKERAVITDDDLVDLHKDIFTGAGKGNKRKILFGGSDLCASFGKIDSNRWEHVGTYKKWDLEFEEWKTNFGSILLCHHELFDQCEMSDKGFILDPEYLYKRVYISWGRNILDLKKAGIRDTNAVVLREVCCLYLRYPNAHARVHLATAS